MVDNLIRLFDELDTDFSTLGLGAITDCESCEVSEEINGQFELTMSYPVSGSMFNDIRLRNIIVTKANPYGTPQAFRIYSITTPIGGVIEVNAQHISYDMSDFIMDPTRNPEDIIEATTLKEHMDCFGPFSEPKVTDVFNFTYDPNIKPRVEDEKYEYEPRTSIGTPVSARGFLGDAVLGNFEAEAIFDNYSVDLKSERGEDRGTIIAYGKNLTDFNQEANISEMVTKVYPYYSSGDVLLTLMTDPEYGYTSNFITVLEAPYTKIGALDLTSEFDEVPSSKELFEKAKKYIEKNKLDKPKVNLSISFVDLASIPEYAEYAALEKVELGDTVHVLFEKFKIASESRVIRYTYDCKADKYTSIDIGDKKETLADTMVKITSDAVTKAEVLDIASDATKLITGNKGGYVVLYDKDGDGKPEEILIMDTPDPQTATQVWRWNKSGLGYSNNGYNPDSFLLAIDMLGRINCDFLKAGTITGRAINGGTITGTVINNGNGTFSVGEDGALNATKAIIKGSIDATDGTFRGTVYATDGSFTGTINATSGSFTGDIKSGSTITCGSQFSVDVYGAVDAKYIECTGTYGTTKIYQGMVDVNGITIDNSKIQNGTSIITSSSVSATTIGAQTLMENGQSLSQRYVQIPVGGEPKTQNVGVTLSNGKTAKLHFMNGLMVWEEYLD